MNHQLETVSSDVRAGVKLAGAAALRFWLTFIVGGIVADLAISTALGDCGGPDWGGCLGPFAIGVAVVASTVLGVVAALAHGVAVFLLRHTFMVMIHSYRVASSALTVLAVLVVGYFVLSLGPSEEVYRRLLMLVVPLPFVLSLLVVPVVSRLRGARRSPEFTEDV